MESKKAFVKKIFLEVFGAGSFDASIIKQYFHPEYVQHVDGKSLNFDSFVQHIKVLKSSIEKVTIDFEHLIEEDDAVCSVHHIDATKINGRQIEAKVIAYMKFKGNQIILCDELTYLIAGDEEDKDLGSRV